MRLVAERTICRAYLAGVIDLLSRKYDFTIKDCQGRTKILDPVRRQTVLLTPEEWVRQHVLRYLIDDRGYPTARLAVERTIRVNNLDKRFDIAFYSVDGQPVLIAEIKRPGQPLNEAAFRQLLTYNQALRARILLWSNGAETHVFDTETGQWLEDVPACPAF